MANYQHIPVNTPPRWQGDERRFAIRLEQIFDEIYAKLGIVRKKLETIETGGVGTLTVSAETLPEGEDATAEVTTGDEGTNIAFGLPRGATGAIGATPAFTIGQVETLLPGEDATASITGTAAAPQLNLGIPKGDKGDAGVSPSLLDVYPVGSIYLSTSAADPGTIFGGTWTRIQDTFLLAAGSTYAAGTTGGEATHTLTTDEMPVHTHAIESGATNAIAWVGSGSGNYALASGSTVRGRRILDAGGGQAHNNMPPFLAVYVWERTA